MLCITCYGSWEPVRMRWVWVANLVFAATEVTTLRFALCAGSENSVNMSLHICPSIHLFTNLYIHTSIHPYIHIHMHASIHPAICLFIHSPICPFIHLFTHLYIHTSIHPYIHPYMHACIYPFIHSTTVCICCWLHLVK